MTRRLNRILTIATAAVLITAVWSVVGHTAWAATRDYLSAGLQFDSWIDPLVLLGGLVTLSVVGVRLVERGWTLVGGGRARRPPARVLSPES
jgi:hypothetical protein